MIHCCLVGWSVVFFDMAWIFLFFFSCTDAELLWQNFKQSCGSATKITEPLIKVICSAQAYQLRKSKIFYMKALTQLVYKSYINEKIDSCHRYLKSIGSPRLAPVLPRLDLWYTCTFLTCLLPHTGRDILLNLQESYLTAVV